MKVTESVSSVLTAGGYCVLRMETRRPRINYLRCTEDIQYRDNNEASPSEPSKFPPLPPMLEVPQNSGTLHQRISTRTGRCHVKDTRTMLQQCASTFSTNRKSSEHGKLWTLQTPYLFPGATFSFFNLNCKNLKYPVYTTHARRDCSGSTMLPSLRPEYKSWEPIK